MNVAGGSDLELLVLSSSEGFIAGWFRLSYLGVHLLAEDFDDLHPLLFEVRTSDDHKVDFRVSLELKHGLDGQ